MAIHANGTTALWAAMCDSGSPLVSLLGFRCIAEKSQPDAFGAALAVLASRRNASLYLFPAQLQLLNEALPTAVNKNTFSQFVTDPKHDALKLDDVTAFLDEEFLHDWAVNSELQSVPGKVQSLAVGAVYAKSLEDGSPIPDSVATIFNSFEKASGDRLAVFVWYAPETFESSRLKAAIERLLQDDNVSSGMYQIALSQKIAFVKSHVDPKAFELSPVRKQRYDRFRQSAAKREGG